MHCLAAVPRANRPRSSIRATISNSECARSRKKKHPKDPMITPTKIGIWAAKSHRRLYPLFLALTLLPITFFAYSIGRVLKHQAEDQAITESTQIAQIGRA